VLGGQEVFELAIGGMNSVSFSFGDFSLLYEIVVVVVVPIGIASVLIPK